VEHLQAVPFGRVVARGEGQAVGRVDCLRRKLDQGCRTVLAEQDRVDVVACEHFRGGLRGPVGEEAAVIADQHPALL